MSYHIFDRRIQFSATIIADNGRRCSIPTIHVMLELPSSCCEIPEV
ncbi:MAG: hypothetical protein LBJ00_16020 [Planctomycetaceae bacterium]|nr:hypothetical protein [Planctomycetaceae bacterium]